jgi:hypothetical protein
MIIIIVTMLNQQSFHLILQVIMIDNDKWTTLVEAVAASAKEQAGDTDSVGM